MRSQASRSSNRDLPASTAKTEMRAAAQTSKVFAPRQGMSKRISCFSLATFNGHRPAVLARQLPAAGQAFVGPFESFHGEHCPVFDDDRLANFQAGYFLGDSKAKRDVFFLLIGQLRAELKIFSRHQWGEPRRGLNQFHAVFFQFIRNRPEDGMGVPFFDLEQQRHRAQIQAQVKEVLRRDLTHHDALFDSAVREGGNHFAQLAHAQPHDFIHKLRQHGVCFILKCDRHDALAPAARAWRANSSGREQLPAMMPMESKSRFICGGQDSMEEGRGKREEAAGEDEVRRL